MRPQGEEGGSMVVLVALNFQTIGSGGLFGFWLPFQEVWAIFKVHTNMFVSNIPQVSNDVRCFVTFRVHHGGQRFSQAATSSVQVPQLLEQAHGRGKIG